MARRSVNHSQPRATEQKSSSGEFDTVFARIQATVSSIETQRDLADLLSIRQSSISDAKRRQVIPGEWAIKLFRIYGINPLWLYEGLPPQVFTGLPGRQSLPARSYDTRQGTLESFLQRFESVNVMVVEIEDASMEPTISRHGCVGINTEDRVLVSNHLYALDLPPEGLTLRRVVLAPDGLRAELRTDAPVIPIESLPLKRVNSHVLGRVVWVMQPPGHSLAPVKPKDKSLANE